MFNYMTGWKKTLGSALSALGTSLMGTGVLPQLASQPSKFLTYVAATGFFLNAMGTFFNHLFAADQVEELKNLSNQQARNTHDIATNEANSKDHHEK